MKKFGRNYELSVEGSDGNILTITLPFTLEMDIERNVLSSANTSSIRIYNLSARHRNLIRKNIQDYGTLRTVILRAGYGDNMPVVFAGNISQAWSVREGTNFITQIECFDGGFAFVNGQTSITFPAGTQRAEVFKALTANLVGVQFGAIGNFKGTLSRAMTLSGNTANILNELSAGGFFVDNSKAYVLSENECIPSQGLDTVDPASGLLNTPVWEATILHFDMLFEPRLVIGQILNLESQTETVLNGQYRVVSLHHTAMISPSVSGDAITSVGMLSPQKGKSLQVVGSSFEGAA